jgi:hypothetical protein
MSESFGFIKVYIKSMKVPTRAVFLEYYSPSMVGFAKSTRSTIQFEDRLDEVQKLMLEDAERLAISTGVLIQIIDLSKQNFISRLVRRLKFPRSPTVVLQGKLFSGILGNHFIGFKHLDETSNTVKLLEEQVIRVHRKHSLER